uniref:Transferrin n=1 Tax=Musca domestica TaxID=7370 RepID=T1PF04_MUSDO
MIPGVEAEGDPTDFEYLCEDGSRRPLDGPACSWAQRPWTGYISNSEAVKGEQQFHNLQDRLEKFFENGLHAENKEAAAHLLINENAVYHKKAEAVDPQQYLEKAGYKDVIERDGSALRKMKMCVQSDIEFQKCNSMRRAAYSRDIRPEMECLKEENCIAAVAECKADMVAIQADHYKPARESKLQPVVYEAYAENDIYVVVIDPALTRDDQNKKPVYYNANDERQRKAVAYLNLMRGSPDCNAQPGEEQSLLIANVKDLGEHKNKQLLCPNGERKPVSEWQLCNFEINLPNAVFIRDSMTHVEQETLKHLFISLSDKFGKSGKLSDVFQLFGSYTPNDNNVLFSNDAVEFITELKNKTPNEELYQRLGC